MRINSGKKLEDDYFLEFLDKNDNIKNCKKASISTERR